jgi:hypothetical protein
MLFAAVETYKKFFQTRIFGGTEPGAPGRKPANDSDGTPLRHSAPGLQAISDGRFSGNLTATQ